MSEVVDAPEGSPPRSPDVECPFSEDGAEKSTEPRKRTAEDVVEEGAGGEATAEKKAKLDETEVEVSEKANGDDGDDDDVIIDEPAEPAVGAAEQSNDEQSSAVEEPKEDGEGEEEEDDDEEDEEAGAEEEQEDEE